MTQEVKIIFRALESFTIETFEKEVNDWLSRNATLQVRDVSVIYVPEGATAPQSQPGGWMALIRFGS
jgi:hypothetical protein